MNSIDWFCEQERVFNIGIINKAKAHLYFVGSTCLFIQQVFVEDLENAGHCAMIWRYGGVGEPKRQGIPHLWSLQ